MPKLPRRGGGAARNANENHRHLSRRPLAHEPATTVGERARNDRPLFSSTPFRQPPPPTNHPVGARRRRITPTKTIKPSLAASSPTVVAASWARRRGTAALCFHQPLSAPSRPYKPIAQFVCSGGFSRCHHPVGAGGRRITPTKTIATCLAARSPMSQQPPWASGRGTAAPSPTPILSAPSRPYRNLGRGKTLANLSFMVQKGVAQPISFMLECLEIGSPKR